MTAKDRMNANLKPSSEKDMNQLMVVTRAGPGVCVFEHPSPSSAFRAAVFGTPINTSFPHLL